MQQIHVFRRGRVNARVRLGPTSAAVWSRRRQRVAHWDRVALSRVGTWHFAIGGAPRSPSGLVTDRPCGDRPRFGYSVVNERQTPWSANCRHTTLCTSRVKELMA